MNNKQFGPGVLVAAAFIGPGTVTACTLAGANFGYALIWALLFATFATIVLQEMSARLGVVTQQGLSESIAQEFKHSVYKWPIFALIAAAIFLGNAAYEGGNLAGAALGAGVIFDSEASSFKGAVGLLSLLAMLVLLNGNYKTIEKLLVILVLCMAIAFILSFIVVKPKLLELLKGSFVPAIPDGSLLTVMALIGTTIVPYNLFLHAASAKQKWSGAEQLSQARRDTALSIGLGGLVAIFIVSTSAASIFAAGLKVSNAADMAVQLEPLFGRYSQWLIGFGLLAAGLSSAITAPLATGYAISGMLNLSPEQKAKVSKWISVTVVIVGAGFTLTGIKPIQIILVAQFANGLLLPIIGCFLLYVMNKSSILGKYTNGRLSNILGVGVIVFTLLLGARLVGRALGWV